MKIKIEKLIFEGKGLGRTDSGKPVFVKKSVPGDELEVEITKDKKSFSEAITKQVIIPSPQRIAPKCPHFEDCGGCEHQNINYQDQLKYKEEIFRETLGRANIETEILPILPGSDSEFFYRNVIRFFFAEDENGNIGFAMHDYKDFNKLIAIDSCLLQSETCNKILKKLEKLLNNSITNDLNNPIDSLWQIRIREGKFTGEFMVEIITRTAQLPLKQEIITLLKTFPEIKSAYHAIALDESKDWQRHILFGSPIIHEKIGKFTFQISPDSFFQTNSLGIKTLYDKIKEFADIAIGDGIIDLYCGTGTIGIYLATLAKEVIGVEINKDAINDARANAHLNKILNCEFIRSDATKWLYDQPNEKLNNKVIILDPPRDGLDKDLIIEMTRLKIKNYVYVSCNPATFARDIKIFQENGLKLKKVQPLDMFPQTHHIECVGLITK